jgi:hypothetical protein
LAQFFSPVSLFLAECFSTFLPAQFIATASPVLLKSLSFLLALIAVMFSLYLLYTSIRDFLFTKVDAQMMRKFIEYISGEISIKDAIDKALSDIAKDLRPSLKYALIHMSYILILVFLYYISLGALLLGVCNFFNAAFLCQKDAVWQVGAVFLAVHIVHTWLSVTSNGKYSLYPHLQLYVLTGFIRQLLSKHNTGKPTKRLLPATSFSIQVFHPHSSSLADASSAYPRTENLSRNTPTPTYRSRLPRHLNGKRPAEPEM